MASISRTYPRLAAVGLGTTLVYTATQSYTRPAHAESPRSDSKAALKKVNFSSFTELRCLSSEQYNHNVKKITFALPENSTSDLPPITSLLTQHTPEGSWIPVFRPYTPVSSDNGSVTFMVKKYEGGKGSTKMHSLKPGDNLKFKSLQELKYVPNEYSEILLIGGGSGITPLYQLTKAVLDNPQDKTKLALIYANNSTEDILLKKEFEELKGRFPDRFKTIFITKDGGNGSEKGYVTREMIGKLWEKKNGQTVLLSGPPAMIEAIGGGKGMAGWTQGSIGGVLKDLGYTKEDVHKF